MNRIRPRVGMSIMMVLAIVTILAFLAAAMSALFLFNVNFAQCSLNGETALAQAEAGIQEVLYRLSQDPEIKLGSKGTEDFEGSVAGEFDRRSSYYRVTFNSGLGFPYSTNNVKKDHPTGYLGRKIPDGCIHLFSTGFCRGQYRTVEALVRQPPCPYGLGSTGSIHSKSPLTVAGTASAADLIAGNSDRPGHIVANSPLGVQIDKGADPALHTKITGFVKSVGPVTVEQPAEVWGGLRPHSSASEIPLFDIRSLDPTSPGGVDLPGVIDILEEQHGTSDLDVIYRCNHNLRFDGMVTLHESFLYVKGNLVINGGLKGTGSVVVDGDVEVNGGVNLEGTNQVALLATGKITVKGAGNYFQGFLYSRKGIVAENITVVGSVLLNGADPNDPSQNIELDHVTVISNEQAGSFSFTSHSYAGGGSSIPADAANYLMLSGYVLPSGVVGDDTLMPVSDPKFKDNILWVLTACGFKPGETFDVATSIVKAQRLVDKGMPAKGLFPKPGVAIPPGAPSLGKTVNPAMEKVKDALSHLQKMRDGASSIPPTATGDDVTNAEQAVKTALDGYIGACTAFGAEYFDFVSHHTNGNLAFRLIDGARGTDLDTPWPFELNKYLPTSDRLQMTYWRVTPRRL